MVEVGNYLYFIMIIITIGIIVGAYFLLRNKPKEFAYKVLLVWCFCNFALHFLKQFYYMSFSSLRSSTAENICAVSTMVFPFIMMYKKESILHDFMYFIGVLGGSAALIYPTEAIGKSLLAFEPIRFYFCHISLLAIPLLLAMLGFYKPRLKKIWTIPLLFLVYELIICINTGIVIDTGLYQSDKYSKVEAFFSRDILNNSFVFGPTSDMGAVGEFIGNLCPSFFKIENFALNGGNLTYIPVIWLTVPSFILFVPIYLILGSPFFIIEYKNNKEKALD